MRPSGRFTTERRDINSINPERLVFMPLLLLVLLSPLPLASVVDWAWALSAVIIGGLLVIWAAVTAWQGEPLPVSINRILPPLILFAAAAIWAGIQMTSWTPPQWHHPIWAEASAILSAEVANSITIDTHETGSALLRLLSYAGVFWLSMQCCGNRDNARIALYAIAGAQLTYAAYGLAVQFGGEPMILWYKKISYLEDVTSTFVNRNSYATFAGLGLVAVTALLCRRLLRIYSSDYNLGQLFRVVISEFLEREWFLILAWIVIAMALLMSNSRAGAGSTFVGLMAFFVVLTASSHVPKRISRSLAVIFLIIGISFLLVSGDVLTKRFMGASIGGEQVRAKMFALSIDAIDDSPTLGTGFGSFEQIFHIYRGDTEPYRVRSKRVHNTYLENAMELGLPAAGALLAAVLYLTGICIMGVLRRQRAVVYPAVGVGATALVGFHSLVDFSLQIPAVAFTYCFLLGLACAQSWSSQVGTPGRRG